MARETSNDDTEPYFENYEADTSDGSLIDEPVCGGDE